MSNIAVERLSRRNFSRLNRNTTVLVGGEVRGRYGFFTTRLSTQPPDIFSHYIFGSRQYFSIAKSRTEKSTGKRSSSVATRERWNRILLRKGFGAVVADRIALYCRWPSRTPPWKIIIITIEMIVDCRGIRRAWAEYSTRFFFFFFLIFAPPNVDGP